MAPAAWQPIIPSRRDGHMAENWISFWNTQHSIYVNARHLDLHYRDVADRLLQLNPKLEDNVLDFGCGEATHADRVAARVGQLWLCEAAERVRDHLRARFGQLANVKVIGSDELRDLAPGTFDLIVANSVAQYLTRDELDALLRTWRQLLKPGRTPDSRRRRSTRRQSDIGRMGTVALRMEQWLSRRGLRRPCPHRAVALSPHSRAARHHHLHRAGDQRAHRCRGLQRGAAAVQFRAPAGANFLRRHASLTAVWPR